MKINRAAADHLTAALFLFSRIKYDGFIRFTCLLRPCYAICITLYLREAVFENCLRMARGMAVQADT